MKPHAHTRDSDDRPVPTDLIVVGARGYGREVACFVDEMRAAGQPTVVIGFLDDDTQSLAQHPGYPPILGSAQTFEPVRDANFVCALGSAAVRRRYVELIEARGGAFPTLVHPTAIVRRHARVGRGVLIHAFTILSCDTVVGDHVHIQGACSIGHDARIGAWAHISPRVFLGGGAVVEEGAQVFTGAIVLPGKRIGRAAVVGAGSVVTRDVPDGTTVMGNPASARGS
jgi:sugar O-acyltransferase (sialic acid O-acetyltransferase NeuD family)